jgi:hypothetical protein
LVKNGSNYYISEYTVSPTAFTTYSIADFNNNSTVGKRWAQYDFTANTFWQPDPSTLTFTAKDFDNVTYVAFWGKGSQTWGKNFGWNELETTANITLDPTYGPPIVTTLAPGQGIGMATIQGELVGEGLSAATMVLYSGTTDGGTSNWDNEWNFGEVATGTYSTQMNVIAESVYYCRAMASNTYGTTWGDVLQFTTLSDMLIFNGDELTGKDNSSKVAWDTIHPTYTNGVIKYANGTNIINFTENLIYTNTSYEQAQMFGGLYLVDLGNNTTPTFYNDISGWAQIRKGYFAMTGKDASSQSQIKGVLLWDKSNFNLSAGNKALTMTDDAAISITLRSYVRTRNNSDGLRFVIKDGGTYYYSESRLYSNFDSPYVFSISLKGERWASWDPTTNPTDFTSGNVLPGGGTFETRSFENVEAVGLSIDSESTSWNSLLDFTYFAATGDIAASNGTLLIIQ